MTPLWIEEIQKSSQLNPQTQDFSWQTCFLDPPTSRVPCCLQLGKSSLVHTTKTMIARQQCPGGVFKSEVTYWPRLRKHRAICFKLTARTTYHRSHERHGTFLSLLLLLKLKAAQVIMLSFSKQWRLHSLFSCANKRPKKPCRNRHFRPSGILELCWELMLLLLMTWRQW